MDLDTLKANLKKDFQEIVSQAELNQLKELNTLEKRADYELSKKYKKFTYKR